MTKSGRFCFTLDVLTDGSEHTGSGTLFLSVWKIPLSVQKDAALLADESESDDSDSSDSSSYKEDGNEEDSVDALYSKSNENSGTSKNSDPYAWLTGAAETEANNYSHVPIARYAISGLGDATARLCADQRFKLAPTKACFLPQVGRLAKSVDGLSALFLALYGAGAPSLHVVFPKVPMPHSIGSNRQKTVDAEADESFVEELATVVLGRHKNMDIRTCEIPQAGQDSESLTWWKVYEDEYLIAHASCCNPLNLYETNEQQRQETPASLVYLYSFPATQLGCNTRTSNSNPYCTLALLPPKCRNMTSVYERLMQQNRPMIRDGVPMTCIDYVLFLDPLQQSNISTTSSKILMTLLQQHDEGILIRSQQLHRYFNRSMPSAFVPPVQALGATACANTSEGNSDGFILKSGTSIVLEKNANESKDDRISTERIWDRRTSIWKKEIKEESTRSTIKSLKSFVVGRTANVASTTPALASDENEIDLEDESDSEEEEEQEAVKEPLSKTIEETTTLYGDGPRLVVLGTGCATPSAYRGSSGYALVLPSPTYADEDAHTANQPYCYSTNGANSDGNSELKGDCRVVKGEEIYLLDCGEGVSTMLSRNCGAMKNWRRHIRGIWISHAHLDHYGGLPTLLRLLDEEQELFFSVDTKAGSMPEPARKRPRHTRSPNTGVLVPWVVAPPKVLRYLDIILDCKQGRSRDGNRVFFEPRLHHDPRLPLGKGSPFFHFENLKVYHNCCPAFGLLVGWKGESNINQFLCYSGDTRPSHNLIRACKRTIHPQQQRYNAPQFHDTNYGRAQSNLFLIHEATFRDAESQMAEKKKHSTLREAWKVANDIPNCSRVLMTHFSQRYDNLLEEDLSLKYNDRDVKGNDAANPSDISTTQPSVGLAVDGLWIGLK